MREECPRCNEGRLYDRKDGKFTLKVCYLCGYYWNDSEGYSDLSKNLFKEYFPLESRWKASPDVGQPYTSPEHWTEPGAVLHDLTL